MKTIESPRISQSLTMTSLIAAMRQTYAKPANVPQRQVLPLAADSHDALALLPAWNDELIAVKTFTYFPGNGEQGKDVLASRLLAFSRSDGAPLASMDAKVLTYWRTAAASALAADYLARKESKTLLICGTGRLAPYFAWAYAAIRPIERVIVWGRDAAKAANAAERIVHGDEYQRLPSERQFSVSIVTDIEQGIQAADIISCVTGSLEPLILGEQVKPGTHVDLVGNHHRQHRECDSELVLRSRVYVDSRINVLAEAGELLIPIAEQIFSPEQIVADLPQLCSAELSQKTSQKTSQSTDMGRTDPDSITLYKSVGSALADLVAAQVVLTNLAQVELG